jgi:Carboxypeptidase regulatory-like domain/TonB-dependent Receptor Plug Domain
MKRFKINIGVLLVLMLALAAHGTLWAQATGSIVGTVSDAAGAAVPDATVTVANTGTGDTRTTKSSATGDYQILQLNPGAYKVTVGGAGFKQFIRTNLEVTVGNATRVDAALEVGAVSETVEVSTESPLVSTQSSSLNYEVGTKQIDNLPLNGRNPLNLTALVPGVVPQGNTSGNASTLNVNGWGNYQIGGGAANQSATYIDGAPINISYANSTSLVATQDVIQEFSVQTNNVNPEYGRFAGGVVSMATKPGTNDIHGTAYEYYRDAVFNANTFFNKHNPANVIARPGYTQHQFGATLGGPIIKNKTFLFLSAEEFSLNNAASTTTTVPTAGTFPTGGNMLAGDFSALCAAGFNSQGICTGTGTGNIQLTDPTTPAHTPYPRNQIPKGEWNQTATILGPMLFPLPTNGSLTNNFISALNKVTVYNQFTVRVDHELNSKNQLFARFTNWHKNASGTSNLNNQIGNKATFATAQAVLGDSITFNQNLVGQVRASFLRFKDNSVPFLCCNFQMSTLGGNWGSYQSQITLAQLPQPAIAGFNNFSTGATILDTDNAYTLSGSLTWQKGRHSIQFGGESRRIEWGYQQSNSPGGTFAFSGTSTGSPYSDFLLGLPATGSAQEPAASLGTMYYSGAFIGDSFRYNSKLTINAGLRWEQPGAFHERNGSLTVLDMTLPQPGLPTVNGKQPVGGLSLVNSARYSSRNWQDLHWLLFSPRVGLAYSPDSKSVVRGGFGISYLPNTVAFSLGPYNNPPNSATTTMSPGASLSNPFPGGLLTPPGRNPAALALLGQGIQSPLPSQRYAYTEQWNLGLQHQFGQGLVIDAGYVGSHGVDLPLYSINLNQLPDSVINSMDPTSLGTYLNTKVSNPFYGIIPSSAGILGQSTIAQGYLLKPYPQFLYVTQDAPTVAGSSYQALQVRVEERMKAAGVLLVSYTHAHLEGTADVLTGYLETSRFGVGGASGVQDNNCISCEYSKSSFDVPNRIVISYTVTLPFGRGHYLLGNANGLVDRLVNNWTFNGIATLQDGFPIAFQDATANALQANYAAGNAGPGLPAGVTRPNYLPNATGCNATKSMPGDPINKLNKYFNTACFAAPAAYQFGNEPRVDDTLRAQGQNNFDISMAKKVQIVERASFEFRAEAFNVFNRVQFAPPTAQADVPSTFGVVSSQVNQPRLLQLSGRINF